MKNVYFYPDYFEANGQRYRYNTPRGHRLYLEMIAEVKAIKIVRPILEGTLATINESGHMRYVAGLELALEVLVLRQHDTENDIETFRKNAQIYKF